eukprot:TRINITY_DN7484_c0_g3_i1.p1 TRINITY_DN7484_c0_g3~~TRINITY_DN7484_c0_g3_i1.p1  ORF type:complete len:197 (+),score=33.86 TRINITY_DN7484_c0_g3_i1:221-811(+)
MRTLKNCKELLLTLKDTAARLDCHTLLARIFPCMFHSECRGRDRKRHCRNIVKDVNDFKERGVAAIFCLLGKYELRAIGVELASYQQACTDARIDLNVFDIIEMGVPESHKVEEFKRNVVDKALEYVKSGKSVLVHCRGGIGRASTVAACILCHVFKGAKPEDMIKMLRRRRDKKAVESYKQEQFIKKYFKEISSH